MRSERHLRRRMMELGIFPDQDIKVIKHHCGCILQVRNCIYVIGKDGAEAVMEMIFNEARRPS